MLSRPALVVALAAAAASWHRVAADLEVTQEVTPVEAKVVSSKVDCGGHFAETCHVCPSGNAWSWCNGDCLWVGGECKTKGPLHQAQLRAERFVQGWWAAFPVFLLATVLMVIYAGVYRQKVVSQYPQDIYQRDPDFDMFREREYGLFAMVEDRETCIWALFCTPVLAAKNYQVGAVLGYWPSCLLMGLMYTPLHCVAALARTVLSQKLKRNLRYGSSFLPDLILSCFCMPCEVGRESLEVDAEEYVEVVCPFVVDSTWVEPAKEADTLASELAKEAREDARSCTSWVRGSNGGARNGDEAQEEGHTGERSCMTWRTSPPGQVEEEENNTEKGTSCLGI